MLTESSTLWAVMVVLYAAGVIVGLAVALQIKSFLNKTPEIDSAASLERFKRIARRNMYVALLQIPLLGTGGVLGIVLVFRQGLSALAGVLALNGLLFGVGRYLSRIEARARSLPAANEELADEYQRVGESWIKKPLPDF